MSGAAAGGGNGGGRHHPRLAVEGTVMSSLSDLMEAEFTFSNGTVNRFNHEVAAASESAAAAAPPNADDNVFGRASPSTVSMESHDSCHSMEAEKKGRLQVSVRPARYARSNSNVSSAGASSAMSVYRMDAQPRGLALIIEIEEYDNDVQERRIGSQYDVENLTKLFEQLFFKVEKRKNLKKRDFDRILYEFSTKEEHRNANMMILAVLSHGRDGHIYTSDGLVITTESIYEKFNNNNCPLLKGKPKFFIIQACRGDETDPGFMCPDEEDVAERPARKRRAPGAGGVDMDTIPFSERFGEMNKARPTWEDMIIAYSTIPGYASMRDHEKGTWFIQSMVEVFMNHACDLELIDLLRQTSEYLSRFTNEFAEKQTCNVEMRHLYKRIYFNPGLANTSKDGAMLPPPVPTQPSSSSTALRRSHSTPPASPRRDRDQQQE